MVQVFQRNIVNLNIRQFGVWLVPDVSNAELFDLAINGGSVYSDIENQTISWIPTEGKLRIQAKAEDSRAIVKLQTNTERQTPAKS